MLTNVGKMNFINQSKRSLKRSKEFALYFLAIFVCLATTVRADPRENNSNTVVILYDKAQEASATSLIDKQIGHTLVSLLARQVRIYRENIDFTQNNDHFNQLSVDYLGTRYANDTPSLIIAVGQDPLRFLLQYGDKLFPHVPLISVGMDPQQVKSMSLPPDITGISQHIDFWPSIALARTFQPGLQHVAVVSGSGLNDQAMEAAARSELQDHQNQVDFIYLTGLPMGKLLQRVSNLPPSTIILYLQVTKDGEGHSFLPQDVLVSISRAANAPTYIVTDNMVRKGAVGGNLTSFEQCGKQTAQLAAQILKGTDPATIPFTVSSKRTILDATQLSRWNFSLKNAPQNTAVIGEEHTVWNRHHWLAVSGIVSLVLLIFLLLKLVFTHRRRYKAEQNLRLSESSKHTAVMEERNRMARDMHDTLAPGFTGIIVQLQAAEHAFANGYNDQANEHVHRAGDIARQSLGEVRRSLKALRSSALEQGSLLTALDTSIKEMTAGTNFQADLSVHGKPLPLKQVVEDHILRITQEFLTNALKHSGGKWIRGEFFFGKRDVRLEMEDDGCGFDVAQKRGGFGLIGIQERVDHMGGRLSVDSRPGQGTRMTVVIPVEKAKSGTTLDAAFQHTVTHMQLE